MEVSISRADLEEQIQGIKKQQEENEKDRLKLFGALHSLEYMLDILAKRERNIAHVEAFKQMEEARRAGVSTNDTKEMDEIDAAVLSGEGMPIEMVMECPNCRTVQPMHRGKCEQELCHYHFE